MEVLSPSKDFYLELLVESNKTPLDSNNSKASTFKKITESAVYYFKNLIETWTSEQLREDVDTSAENEMSIVVLGKMDEENFLLTGDAGLRALDEAIVYAEEIYEPIKDTVDFMQIPHHGGRHNVSPSILDRLIGPITDEEDMPSKTAFVSVAQN